MPEHGEHKNDGVDEDKIEDVDETKTKTTNTETMTTKTNTTIRKCQRNTMIFLDPLELTSFPPQLFQIQSGGDEGEGCQGGGGGGAG